MPLAKYVETHMIVPFMYHSTISVLRCPDLTECYLRVGLLKWVRRVDAQGCV